ncbi:ABC transporter ATP-binding protein [Tersicoccus solisilvae]|uniref:ABC transporter ATP-binding protein n=1 Tax=Tersicoccus solisilvae TaxID=1882339 RepID=A0ABQ1P3N7_9MICC|nr:ABC transporter ATP-binding protein [Tersicoccus solisilvae]GGC90344.1 ABC transporter ATP-binding protein [Tersicoccus solisilvae]
MSAPAVLSARDLRCGYGATPVCGPVTTSVAPGEVLGIVGFNGAGKSTVVRTMIGRQPPLDGECRFRDLLVDDRAASFRAAVSCVFDEDAFFPSLTAAEHLELVARGHGVPEPVQAVRRELDAFGITAVADALPTELSSGQRRRLLLAAGFIRPAELLVLDEPEQRLDPVMRELMGDRIRARAAGGCAVVVVTHAPDLLLATASTCLVIADEVRRVPVAEGAALISGTRA